MNIRFTNLFRILLVSRFNSPDTYNIKFKIDGQTRDAPQTNILFGMIVIRL